MRKRLVLLLAFVCCLWLGGCEDKLQEGEEKEVFEYPVVVVPEDERYDLTQRRETLLAEREEKNRETISEKQSDGEEIVPTLMGQAPKGAVLTETEAVRLEIVSVTERSNLGYVLQFRMENKTGELRSGLLTDLCINGITVTRECGFRFGTHLLYQSFELKEYEVAEVEFVIPKAWFEDTGVEAVTDIRFFWGNYRKGEELGTLQEEGYVFYPFGEEQAVRHVRTPQPKDFSVFENEDCSMKIIDVVFDAEEGFAGVLVYVENHTDRAIRVSLHNMYVNGYYAEHGERSTVLPETVCYDWLIFYGGSIGEVYVEELAELEFQVYVYEEEDISSGRFAYMNGIECRFLPKGESFVRYQKHVPQGKEVVLLDTEWAVLMATGLDTASYWDGYRLNVYMENKTDEVLYFVTDEDSYSGGERVNQKERSLEAGKRWNTTFYWKTGEEMVLELISFPVRLYRVGENGEETLYEEVVTVTKEETGPTELDIRKENEEKKLFRVPENVEMLGITPSPEQVEFVAEGCTECVVDNELFTFEVLRVVSPDSYGGAALRTRLVNKTNIPLMFRVNTESVNGVETNCVDFCTMQPGEEYECDMSVTYEALEKLGIDNITDITFRLSVDDREYWGIINFYEEEFVYHPTGERIRTMQRYTPKPEDLVLFDNAYGRLLLTGYSSEEMERVCLYPKGEEAAQQVLEKKNKEIFTVFESDELLIFMTGISKKESGGACLYLTCENRTGEELEIEVGSECFLNKIEFSGGDYIYLPGGEVGKMEVEIPEDVVAEAFAEGLCSVTILVRAESRGRWKWGTFLLESCTVTIP